MNDLTQLKKALDMASGGALQQPLVDRVLQELIEVNNPLRVNLPRKPGSGSAWVLNQRTSRGAGAGFVNDTEEPTETQGSVAQKSFPYQTILDRRKVTRKLQAVGKSLLDVEAEEVENGLQNVRDSEENALVNGDAAVNPKQFNGLRKIIPGGQVVVAGANGAPLSLDLMDQAIDLNRGNPTMLIMSKKANRKLNALTPSAVEHELWTGQIGAGAGVGGIPGFVGGLAAGELAQSPRVISAASKGLQTGGTGLTKFGGAVGGQTGLNALMSRLGSKGGQSSLAEAAAPQFPPIPQQPESIPQIDQQSQLRKIIGLYLLKNAKNNSDIIKAFEFIQPESKLTAVERGKLQEAKHGLNLIDVIENRFNRIQQQGLTAQSGGLGRLGGLLGIGASITQPEGSGAAAYKDGVEAFLARIARAAGEKGTLATEDINRIKKAIPNFFDTSTVLSLL